jgi:hypothetical protein
MACGLTEVMPPLRLGLLPEVSGPPYDEVVGTIMLPPVGEWSRPWVEEWGESSWCGGEGLCPAEE